MSVFAEKVTFQKETEHQEKITLTGAAGLQYIEFANGTVKISSGNNSVNELYEIKIGHQAGALGSGRGCIKMSYRAGYRATGSYNIDLGYQSGYQRTTGGYNVNLGYAAGINFTTGADRNVCIGSSAGRKIIRGDNNVFIGPNAGYGVTNTICNNSICIGVNSGYQLVQSNQLYIGPDGGLIFGKFIDKMVRVNGTFEIQHVHDVTTESTKHLVWEFSTGKVLAKEINNGPDLHKFFSHYKEDFATPSTVDGIEEVAIFSKPEDLIYSNLSEYFTLSYFGQNSSFYADGSLDVIKDCYLSIQLYANVELDGVDEPSNTRANFSIKNWNSTSQDEKVLSSTGVVSTFGAKPNITWRADAIIEVKNGDKIEFDLLYPNFHATKLDAKIVIELVHEINNN